MKKYLSMLLFVVILGTVATGILMGADYITKDAIARNAEYSWKSAVLNHHEIPHTTVDFSDVFDANFEVLDALDTETNTTLYLYKNLETNYVSFRFNGYGLWDVIEGVLTLGDDFNTIINVTVTKQAETPGLGGIVAEEQYLRNYIGKKFDETLGIVAVKVPPTQDYEVDAITGATGTSNAFVDLLSANYRKYVRLFGDVNPDADFQTIVKISVFEQSEKWGKSIQTNVNFFDGYIGKKFNPDIVVVSEPTLDNEVLDGYGSATTTKLQLTTSLNTTYQVYYNAFKDGE